MTADMRLGTTWKTLRAQQHQHSLVRPTAPTQAFFPPGHVVDASTAEHGMVGGLIAAVRRSEFALRRPAGLSKDLLLLVVIVDC